MKSTTVMSVRGMRPEDLRPNPDFVYVGRAIHRLGWKDSIWGNPFKMAKGALVVDFSRVRSDWWRRHGTFVPSSPITILDLYLRWVLYTPTLSDRLSELRGKTLGCWCGCWEPGQPEIGCHAVVLAKLADGWDGNSGGGYDGR